MPARLLPARPRLTTIVISITMLLLLLLPGTAFARSNAGSGFYQQTNLTSDIPGKAMFTDAHLVNPWGISFAPGGAFLGLR